MSRLPPRPQQFPQQQQAPVQQQQPPMQQGPVQQRAPVQRAPQQAAVQQPMQQRPPVQPQPQPAGYGNRPPNRPPTNTAAPAAPQSQQPYPPQRGMPMQAQVRQNIQQGQPIRTAPQQQAPQQQLPQGYVPPGMFAGIENEALHLDRGDYIGRCHMLARIDTCKIGQSSQGKGFFFAAELTVIYLFQDHPHDSHQIGDDVTFMTMANNVRYYKKDVKSFVAVATSCDPAEITEPNIMEIVGPAQPLTGTVVEIEGTLKAGVQKPGSQYTRVRFHREVRPNELVQILPPEHQLYFFPPPPGEEANYPGGMIPFWAGQEQQYQQQPQFDPSQGQFDPNQQYPEQGQYDPSIEADPNQGTYDPNMPSS